MIQSAMGEITAKSAQFHTDREEKIGYSECNLIVFDWISTKPHIFVSGLRELSPRHFKKRRNVMFIL